ncbi:TPA: hypothetical protein ACNTVZ_004291, partial [Escherichia coli]
DYGSEGGGFFNRRIWRSCFIVITQKLQSSIFRGTDIKNSPFASSPEMINSGIMCALCDYNENKNHHTTFNIREPDLTP